MRWTFTDHGTDYTIAPSGMVRIPNMPVGFLASFPYVVRDTAGRILCGLTRAQFAEYRTRYALVEVPNLTNNPNVER